MKDIYLPKLTSQNGVSVDILRNGLTRQRYEFIVDTIIDAMVDIDLLDTHVDDQLFKRII